MKLAEIRLEAWTGFWATVILSNTAPSWWTKGLWFVAALGFLVIYHVSKEPK